MRHVLVRLVVNSLGVLLASTLFGERISVAGVESAALFALVLGLCNALVRPLLFLLTLPLTCLTLGVFTLIVNALVFWLATMAPVGVRVSGFDGAFLGALTVSLVSVLASWLIGPAERAAS